jgi:hypothetical protein
MGEPEVEDAVQSLMAGVGGKLTEVIETRIWRYFPHITSRAMGEGWFDQVESMQGEQATYYTGAQLDLDIVEGAVSFSKALVRRHFE